MSEPALIFLGYFEIRTTTDFSLSFDTGGARSYKTSHMSTPQINAANSTRNRISIL